MREISVFGPPNRNRHDDRYDPQMPMTPARPKSAQAPAPMLAPNLKSQSVFTSF